MINGHFEGQSMTFSLPTPTLRLRYEHLLRPIALRCGFNDATELDMGDKLPTRDAAVKAITLG